MPGANGWCPGTSNLMAGCSKIKDYLCWFTSNNMSEKELNIAICIKGWDGATVLPRSWEIFATRYPCIQFRLIFEENLWRLSKRGANLGFWEAINHSLLAELLSPRALELRARWVHSACIRSLMSTYLEKKAEFKQLKCSQTVSNGGRARAIGPGENRESPKPPSIRNSQNRAAMATAAERGRSTIYG